MLDAATFSNKYYPRLLIRELENALTAPATGCAGNDLVRAANRGDCDDSLATTGHHRADGIGLRTHAFREGRIFDIASDMNGAVLVLHRRAHMKTRVRRMRFLPDLGGGVD